jgi:hypothetical protein
MKHANGGLRGPFSLPLWAHDAPAAPAMPLTPWGEPHPHAFAADTGDPPTAPAGETALPRLLSCAEVGKLFNRTTRTLRHWIRLGHLVPVRIGGALFFHPEDIRRLIAGRLCTAILERCGGAGGLVSQPSRGHASTHPKAL